MIYQQIINKYFDDVEDYEEDEHTNTLSFKVMWGEVTFDALQAISLILGTKMINFHRVDRSWGFCDTCAGGETYTIVKCSDVQFGTVSAIPEPCVIVHDPDVNIEQ